MSKQATKSYKNLEAVQILVRNNYAVTIKIKTKIRTMLKQMTISHCSSAMIDYKNKMVILVREDRVQLGVDSKNKDKDKIEAII